MNFLAKNISFLLSEFDVTQSELASWLDKGQTTVGGYASGKTEPNIDLLIKISNIFGVYIDDLIRIDIEKGKVITAEHLSEFKVKGKVIGKPIGKLTGKKYPTSEDDRSHNLMLNEGDPIKDWTLLTIMKGMDGKIDQVLNLIENQEKKGY